MTVTFTMKNMEELVEMLPIIETLGEWNVTINPTKTETCKYASVIELRIISPNSPD